VDAYGLALHRLRHGAPAGYADINPLINGGICDPYAIRAGIRDAHKDYERLAA